MEKPLSYYYVLFSQPGSQLLNIRLVSMDPVIVHVLPPCGVEDVVVAMQGFGTSVRRKLAIDLFISHYYYY